MEEIHIVVATNNRYAKPLAVMLNSLFKNKISKNTISIYILYSRLSKKNEYKLSEIANKFNFKVQFLRLEKSLYSNYPLIDYLTAEAYYRIFIPDLLEKKIKKAIYLDCDIIIKEDLSKLWEIDIENYFLAAVRDDLAKYRYTDLSIPVGCYFNSGVLLINLQKWRENHISDKVIKFIRKNPDKILWADQDALNAILYDKWLMLDPKWNYQANSLQLMEPSIIHYVGFNKPWKKNHPFRNEYHKYSATTPW
ncbi:Lipopolysaccharide biosynthesis protein, LPS:glycosyltransferase [Fictibacillus solisalsi]|uniref:Lipopolysaccharide biosynthesis protein, LPS:glycosyltransferase n=2 Tax=Fictibacillus solisalsi TaxID=459525 RepID=A0A1G9WI63_9BACL|nr:Lipopolysaccharide biosynthesis protein, LPS:glycosyltransferase [Fictibacillus solisalsi]